MLNTDRPIGRCIIDDAHVLRLGRRGAESRTHGPGSQTVRSYPESQTKTLAHAIACPSFAVATQPSTSTSMRRLTMVNEPTYAESLRLGWSVLWRSVGSFLAVLSAINGWIFWTMPELTRADPSILIAIVPICAAVLLCAFIVMPFVVRSILHKRFGRFHLQLIHEGRSQA